MKTILSLIEIKEISFILFEFLELRFSFGVAIVGKDTTKKPVVKETPKEAPQQPKKGNNTPRLESNNNTSNN